MAFSYLRVFTISAALVLLTPCVQSVGFLDSSGVLSEHEHTEDVADGMRENEKVEMSLKQLIKTASANANPEVESEATGDDNGEVDDEGDATIEVFADDGSQIPKKMRTLFTSLIRSAGMGSGDNNVDAREVDNESGDKIMESAGEDAEASSDSESNTGGQHNVHIAAEVAGKRLKMLVDTGAAISLMSKSLAKQLGLLSRMDGSMLGSIEGIGEARVLGTLWNVPVKLGKKKVALSFYVVSMREPLLLLGVDQLRKFKCLVDLDGNYLIFGGRHGIQVPFLPYQPAQFNPYDD